MRDRIFNEVFGILVTQRNGAMSSAGSRAERGGGESKRSEKCTLENICRYVV